MRLAAAAAAVFVAGAIAADVAIAPFSSAPPGEALPAGWRARGIAREPPSEITLAADGGATVLRVRSHGTAGIAAFALAALPVRGSLAWRWKVDRVVAKADLFARSGDDFAARVYVFLEIPEAAFPWHERLRLRIARLVYGAELPSAAICYVWDNRHPVGTSAWNPYARRVRTVVLESGGERAGTWVDERRDLGADFRAAFGDEFVAAARVTGIAAGNDTDQTGESATAWFGDFRLQAEAAR